MRHWFRVFLVILGAASLLLAGRRHFTSAGAGDSHSVPGKAPPLQFLGTASCAAAACHHGGGPLGAPGSEYTTWSTRDKHARAYDVLFQPRSVAMVKRLGLGKAHEEKLCLSCHVRSNYEETRHDVRFSKADGVGCESCHGPAERWVGLHHRGDWKGKSAEEKRALGFADTRSLPGRAQGCVACHVGTPDSEVNHDLIAAGHPRLAFEFSAYHANMPRHWSAAKDRARYPDLEVRAWQVGQAVSAATALTLLRSRAESKKAPWPEFAEYDCAACHHHLQSPSARQKRGYAGRVPLPWGGWYTALLREATAAPVAADLAELRKLMERPLPNRSEVAAKATGILGQLKGRAAKLAFQPVAGADDLFPRFHAIARAGENLPALGWDEAAQVYLALAAYHHTLRDLDAPALPPAWRDELLAVAKSLEFPPGFDTPKGFDPEAFRVRLQALTKTGTK